jgi:ABC-type xylose transport system substrate-binding protein
MALSREEAAKELYFQEYSQIRISNLIDVSEQTISRWVKKGDWAAERAERMNSKKSIQTRIQKLIDYQLWCIEMKINQCMEKGIPTPIDKGEVDALSKLFAGVREKEVGFVEAVKLITKFADYVNTQDPKTAKMLLKYTDEFLIKLKNDFDK